jgi:hypothetical protein
MNLMEYKDEIMNRPKKLLYNKKRMDFNIIRKRKNKQYLKKRTRSSRVTYLTFRNLEKKKFKIRIKSKS